MSLCVPQKENSDVKGPRNCDRVLFSRRRQERTLRKWKEHVRSHCYCRECIERWKIISVRWMVDRYARIAKNRSDDCSTGGRIIDVWRSSNKVLSCKFVSFLIFLSLISATCNRKRDDKWQMRDAYVSMRPLLFKSSR